jgi:hypothetical protein
MRHLPSIHNLRVCHWPKPSGDPATGFMDSKSSSQPHALFLDTCLRQLTISVGPTGQSKVDWPGRAILCNITDSRRGPEVYDGENAYRFLLEVTTGLRSAVPGETNIFGQFKRAWQLFKDSEEPARVAGFAPVMHRLFNDTKSIRNACLEGIGGSSYGSLARKLIRPLPDDRILIVGAGELARSILPMFRSFEVGLWNHRPTENTGQPGDLWFAPEDGRSAAGWADHVILTTPPNEANDLNWQQWIAATDLRCVVHLGHRRSPNSADAFRPGNAITYDLDDLFALRRRQADFRSARLDRAKIECRQSARNFLDQNDTATAAAFASV